MEQYLRNLQFVEIDTQYSDRGITVRVFRYPEEGQDVAVIKILPGCKTPKQEVAGGEITLEGFIKGTGSLIIERKNGIIDTYSYDDSDNTKTLEAIIVNIGDTMQWKNEGEEPLFIYEYCDPEYEEGRFINLD